jgi:hypothetical protein
VFITTSLRRGTLLLLVLLAVSGCGQARSHPQPSPAASITDAQLLQQILAGLGGTEIQAGSIVPVPPEAQDSTPPWVAITVARSDGAAGARARWESDIAAGAFMDAAKADGLPVPSGVTIVTPSDSAACLPQPILAACDAPYFTLPPGDFGAFAPTATDAASLTAELTSNAASAGLTSISVSFEHASGNLVPVVEGETMSPTTFTSRYGTGVAAVFGDTNRFEGVFLTVLNGNGVPVSAAGVASRIGSGESWVDPSTAGA